MSTNSYSVDSDADGLKYPKDLNPAVPEKNSRIGSRIRNHRAFGSNISCEVQEIMSGKIPQILGTIDKKLEELLFLKNDLDKLNEGVKNMEEMLSKYVLILNNDERADLNEAMEEYATGKTTSLKDADMILEL